jgi:hypothetical protein
MGQADDRLYARAIERMLRAMLWLGAAGVVVACLGWGWRAGIGYGMGAAASWTMFRWLHHFVEALSGKPARTRILVLAALRYLLLGVGLYVIFRFSKTSLMAALAGLFASTAAAIAEGTLDHQDLQ